MTVSLTFLYAMFAAISIGVNLGSQWLSNWIYGGGFHIPISMLVGTATGLVAKYFLDKRWVFRFQTSNARHEAKTFFLYTLMGGITTMIFWGMEALFQLLFGTDLMRYLGGLIGLVFGYFIKYMLDKRLVFVKKDSVV